MNGRREEIGIGQSYISPVLRDERRDQRFAQKDSKAG